MNIFDLKNNKYISDNLKLVINDNGIMKNLYYCFNNISISYLKTLEKKLIKAAFDNLSDKEIIYIIVDWIKGTKDSHYVKFKLSYNEYIDLKIEESIGFIKDDKSLVNNIHLDIGAGDCALSFLIGERLKMKSFGVDIDTEIDWSGDSKDDPCKGRKILYDGTNIKDVNKILIKKFKIKKPIIGLCTYNHSIHHFGSFDNIETSIKQVSRLLKNDGYILFREHNIHNNLDNYHLNLQHILLFIRYTYDKTKGIDEFIKLYRKFIDEFTSNYFGNKYIEQVCSKNKLKLIYKKKRIIPEPINKKELIKNGINPDEDISKTYLYIFKKIKSETESKNKTKKKNKKKTKTKKST